MGAGLNVKRCRGQQQNNDSEFLLPEMNDWGGRRTADRGGRREELLVTSGSHEEVRVEVRRHSRTRGEEDEAPGLVMKELS